MSGCFTNRGTWNGVFEREPDSTRSSDRWPTTSARACAAAVALAQKPQASRVHLKVEQSNSGTAETNCYGLPALQALQPPRLENLLKNRLTPHLLQSATAWLRMRRWVRDRLLSIRPEARLELRLTIGLQG